MVFGLCKCILELLPPPPPPLNRLSTDHKLTPHNPIGGVFAGAVGTSAAGAAGIGLIPAALGAVGFTSTGVAAG